MNLAEWTVGRKVALAIGVVILAIVLIVVIGPSKATQELKALPTDTIEVVNKNGEEISLEVKVGGPDASLAGVSQSVAEKVILYSSTPYPASAGQKIGKVEIPLEVALFDGKGRLVRVYRVPPNTPQVLNPQKEYQHILYAPEGLLSEKGISVDNQSKLTEESVLKGKRG